MHGSVKSCRGALLGGVITVVAWCGRASGQSDTPTLPTRLSLSGAPCTSTETLQAAIEGRSQRIEFTEGATHSVEVEITPPDGKTPWQATIHVNTPTKSTRRALEADSCEELMDAASLVAAITLDPPAAGANVTHERPPQGEGQGEGAGEGKPVASPATSGQGAQDESSQATEPRVEQIIVREPAAVPDSAFTSHQTLSLSGLASLGIAPQPLFGARLGGHLRWEPVGGGVVAPAVNISLQAERGVVGAEYGRAGFSVLASSAELCPIRLGSRSVAMRTCAWLLGGVLLVDGSDTEAPESHRRPWGIAGASAELAWSTADWELLLSAAVGLPLVRDTFQFDPEVFHEVGPWAGQIGLGVGHVLP